ncbi:hypothetical protein D3C81_1298280 [compost metagenome]
MTSNGKGLPKLTDKPLLFLRKVLKSKINFGVIIKLHIDLIDRNQIIIQLSKVTQYNLCDRIKFF